MKLRRSGRLTRHRGIRALAVVVTAVVAAVTIGGAIPASAETHTVYTTEPEGNRGGKAYFGEFGDHMQLCDRAGDYRGVGVFVEYIHEEGGVKEDWYWHGGGAGSCRDINLRVAEDTNILFFVCLADHTKKGGKNPDPIAGTCSGWAKVYNNNNF